jgi:hypothetical protein
MKDKPQWTELCQQASVEQDHEKLMELINEITRLLDEKETRLRPTPPNLARALKVKPTEAATERECPGGHKTYRVLVAEPPTGVGMVHNLRHECGEFIMPVQGNSNVSSEDQTENSSPLQRSASSTSQTLPSDSIDCPNFVLK